MNTPIDEEFSSLFDDETQGIDKELSIDRLCHEQKFKDRWSRYQLVHDSLRRSLPPAVDPNFSARIMQALESEPAILAPVTLAPAETLASRKKDVATNTAPTNGLPQISNVFAKLHTRTGKRIAGFAVAATVAAVSVVSFQYSYQQQTTNGSAELANTGFDSNSNVVAITNRSRAPNMPTIFSSAGQEAVAGSASVANSRIVSAVSPNRNSIGPLQSPHNLSRSPVMTPSMQVIRSTAPADNRRPLNVSNPTISAQLHKYLINHSQNVSGTQLQGLMPYARIVAGSAPVTSPRSSAQQNLPRQ